MENGKGARAWLRQTPHGLWAELGAVPLGGHRRLLVRLPPPGPLGGSFCAVAPRSPDVRLLPPTRGELSPDGTILEVLVRPTAFRTVRWSCSLALPRLSAVPFSLTVTAHCRPGVCRAKARLEDWLCRLEAAWGALKKQREAAARLRSPRRPRPKSAGAEPESERQQLVEGLPEAGGHTQVLGCHTQLLGPTGRTPQQEDTAQAREAAAAWEEARQLWGAERAAAASRRPRVAPTAEELDTQECLALADRAEEWVRLQQQLFGPPAEEGPAEERRRAVYQPEGAAEAGSRRGSPRDGGAGDPAVADGETIPVASTVSDVGAVTAGGDAVSGCSSPSSSSSSSCGDSEGVLDAEWLWRRRALERFQWAARRVVLRGRLLRRLGVLSALLAAIKDQRRVLGVRPREEVAGYPSPAEEVAETPALQRGLPRAEDTALGGTGLWEKITGHLLLTSTTHK